MYLFIYNASYSMTFFYYKLLQGCRQAVRHRRG